MKNLIITGKIINNPELVTDKNGDQFIGFTVNVVEEVPTYHSDLINVIAMGKLAEFVRAYLKKGNSVLVEGVPIPYGYINKENEVVTRISLFTNNIESLSS